MNAGSEILKAWRLVTAPARAMPSFVIAGAPKCGTSTLYDCIAAHPRVRRGFRKEPTNLIHYPGSRIQAAANFPIRLPGRPFIVGDGSVEYFVHPDGAKNVREVLPSARLIFLLRDPVQRAWSDYQMYRAHGDDDADFSKTVEHAMKWLLDPEMIPLVDAAVRRPMNPLRYVICGMYAMALERWFSVFPREQCMVIFTEEFASDRDGILGKVFDHIGLNAVPISEVPRAREGGYSERMTEMTAAKLREFFAPHDEKLTGMLGRDLPWR